MVAADFGSDLHARILEVTSQISDATTQEALRLLLSLIGSLKSSLVGKEADSAFEDTPRQAAAQVSFRRPDRAQTAAAGVAQPPMWMRVAGANAGKTPEGGAVAAARRVPPPVRPARLEGGQNHPSLDSVLSAGAVAAARRAPPPVRPARLEGGQDHPSLDSVLSAGFPEQPNFTRLVSGDSELSVGGEGASAEQRREVRRRTWTAKGGRSKCANPPAAEEDASQQLFAMNEEARVREVQDSVDDEEMLSSLSMPTFQANGHLSHRAGVAKCEQAEQPEVWNSRKATTLGVLPAFSSRPQRPVPRATVRRGSKSAATEEGLRQLYKMAEQTWPLTPECEDPEEPVPSCESEAPVSWKEPGKAMTLDVLPLWLQHR